MSAKSKKFIEKAVSIHGNKYDYSLVKFINSKTKVDILCPIHGIFSQRPDIHIGKQASGCKKCGDIIKNKSMGMDLNEFIKKSKIVHNNRYDYSRVNYVNNYTKVEIVCKKHGSFFQEPKSHLDGFDCIRCANEGRIPSNKFIIDDFVKKARYIHGDKYDYSLVKYETQNSIIKIICNIHGEFEQSACAHMNGKGCLICGNIESAKKRMFTTDEFIKIAKSIHGDKYNYSLCKYLGQDVKVDIICNIDDHGIFSQTPSNHYIGHGGCPKCSYHQSTGEDEIALWIESIGVDIIRGSRDLIRPKEIDIYLPKYKLGIEYNGEYWHSEKFGKVKNSHKLKANLAKESGIHLMQFWDSEWINKKDIVKSIILNKLGKSKKKYFARKLQIRSVSSSKSRIFCNNNHIHGFRGGVKHNGLYDGDNLIALMITASDGEMVRFVVKCFCSIVGGFSKLLKYSDVKYSYVDQRIFTGSGYYKNGFKYKYTTSPNYFYKKGSSPMESRQKYQKHKLSKIFNNFDDSLTEVKNMNNNGYYRVFDCGHLKFEIDK